MRSGILGLLVAVFACGLAYGQVTTEEPISEEPCFWYSDNGCFSYDDGAGGGGGDPTGGGYAACVAKKSEGQECQAVVTLRIPDSMCAAGCKACAGVAFSASCQCDGDTLKVTGKCVYW